VLPKQIVETGHEEENRRSIRPKKKKDVDVRYYTSGAE